MVKDAFLWTQHREATNWRFLFCLTKEIKEAMPHKIEIAAPPFCNQQAVSIPNDELTLELQARLIDGTVAMRAQQHSRKATT